MKKTTAILYKLDKSIIDKQGIANLSIEHLEPENGKTYELDEMQKAVEGYIEIAGTISIDNKNYTIVVNEEGLIKDLPINHGFWWAHGNKEGKHKYVGNVLLIPEEMLE
jgi:hypothetical protein